MNNKINEQETLYSIYDINNNVVCSVCESELLNFEHCSCCDKYFVSDAMESLYDYYGNEILDKVCKNCALRNYYYCEHCNRFFKYEDTMCYVNNVGSVCDNCLNNYSYCDRCEQYFENSDIYCDDYNDNYYCSNCYDIISNRRNNEVYEYHEFNNWKLYKLDNETPNYYIGFENEIEPSEEHNHSEVVPLITNSINAVCMYDGSLASGGIEIVSHPQSYKYIMKHKNDYIKLFDKLRNNYKYISHNSTRCGLHFHVTRPENEDVINRIWHILETYKHELILFSRRNENQIIRWSKFMSDNSNTYGEDFTYKIKSTNYIGKLKDTYNRYFALNLTNRNTIEFRFIRGTLKPETFFASVELINNIMKYCSNLNIPLEKITWDKLTKTKYAKKYCEEANIKSNKTPIDLTTLIDKYENEQTLLLNKAKKLIDSLSKKILNELSEYTTKNTSELKAKNTYELERCLSSMLNHVRTKQQAVNNLYDIVSNAKMLMNEQNRFRNNNYNISKYYNSRLANISNKLIDLKNDLIKAGA